MGNTVATADKSARSMAQNPLLQKMASTAAEKVTGDKDIGNLAGQAVQQFGQTRSPYDPPKKTFVQENQNMLFVGGMVAVGVVAVLFVMNSGSKKDEEVVTASGVKVRYEKGEKKGLFGLSPTATYVILGLVVGGGFYVYVNGVPFSHPQALPQSKSYYNPRISASRAYYAPRTCRYKMK